MMKEKKELNVKKSRKKLEVHEKKTKMTGQIEKKTRIEWLNKTGTNR